MKPGLLHAALRRLVRAGSLAAAVVMVATFPLPIIAADAPTSAAASAAPQKVFRLALRTAETGFDPARVSDLYSTQINAHMFEGLYQFDHLARPFKIKPLTADGMPQVSADFRVWTVKVRPGIFFADDPAFGGKPRELVAQDFVYALKRYADPAIKSPSYSTVQESGFIGLEELREQALKNKKPFDYDREIEGVKALDRYTVRFTMKEPRPRFLHDLVGSSQAGVAREVVEKYGDDIMGHPVGTGPFVLKQWRRSSLIVLERNPGYRERYYDAEPATDDAEGQALLARFKGRRLPMIDRVEVSVIEESQPRWLAFLNGQIDLIDPVPPDLANAAAPLGKLAPGLAKKGIRAHRIVAADVTMSYFNMDDPVVGGYTPDKVALRRAIGLGVDLDREIRLVRRGQGIPAQSGVPPNTWGYDPTYKSSNSEYSPSRAKALLDLYGYVDRDGDGWRDQPDGKPLAIEYSTQADQISRQLDELWQKNLNAIGIRVVMRPKQFSENLKAARAGKLMMWSLGSSANTPDGFGGFQRVYGPLSGGANLARFKLDALDELYRRSNELPDGPERLALGLQMNKLVAAYMPYKQHVHRVLLDLSQPWLVGYRRPLFWYAVWMYMDVDMAQRAAAQ